MEKPNMKCKFCGHKYPVVYDNLTLLCCKKAFYGKRDKVLVEEEND